MALYVKNMPFKIANDNIENMTGQPVSNMWNSMAFANRAIGREVIKLYIQYPVKDNILLLDAPTVYFPNVARRPSSSYGTSSASSDVFITRADTRGLRSGPGHDTIMAADTWRRAQSPLTPSRGARGSAFNGSSMTPFDRRPIPQQPRFPAQTGSPRSPAGPTFTPSTFTTPDEQTLGAFQGFQALGQQNNNQQSPVTNNARGGLRLTSTGFRAACDSRGNMGNAPGHLNINRPNLRGGFRGGLAVSLRFPIHHTQTEQYHNTPGSGLGLTLPTSSPAFKQSPHSAGRLNGFDNTGLSPARQMPSPAATAFESPADPFKDHHSPLVQPQAQMAGQATVALQNAMRRGNTGGAPLTAQPVVGSNSFNGITRENSAPALRPTSPVKHARSMPNMMNSPVPRLDAKASEFVPQSEKKPVQQDAEPPSSCTIRNMASLAELNRQSSLNDLNKSRADRSSFHTWLADTPTKQMALQVRSPTVSQATDTSLSPDKVKMMKPAERVEYLAAQIRVKELDASMKKAAAEKAEIEVREARIEQERMRMQLRVAAMEHNVDRGDLASSTKDDELVHSPDQPSNGGSDEYYRVPSISSREFNNHYPQPEDWHQSLKKSSQGSDRKPVAWMNGNPLGASKQPKPFNAGTNLNSNWNVLGHSRNQSIEEGYTSSYDARMARNVEALVNSPSNSSKSRRPEDLDPTPTRPATTWNNRHFPTPQHRGPPRMAPLLHKSRGIENLSARQSVSSKCKTEEMMPSAANTNSDSSGSDGARVCYGEDHRFVDGDHETDTSDDSHDYYVGGGVALGSGYQSK